MAADLIEGILSRLADYDAGHGNLGCTFDRCIHDAVVALRVVLEMHHPIRQPSGVWLCDRCVPAVHPCPEVRKIAEALGVETRDG